MAGPAQILVRRIARFDSAVLAGSTTTCTEGQLTVPQSCVAVLLPADILKPENN